MGVGVTFGHCRVRLFAVQIGAALEMGGWAVQGTRDQENYATYVMLASGMV